jgi:hypothetical protein
MLDPIASPIEGEDLLLPKRVNSSKADKDDATLIEPIQLAA